MSWEGIQEKYKTSVNKYEDHAIVPLKFYFLEKGVIAFVVCQSQP